ncbi:MAG: dienelactone hydrolase family protein [Proteobacteria bacterium]|nr:dienelactone hydrolase family protein [Pseudomonadota bacterium]
MKSISIAYSVNDAPYEGALIYNDAVAHARPGVLLAPDWMGVSDQAVAHAQRIAEAGYVVFVADMYGLGRRPTNRDEAAALAAPLKDDVAESCRRSLGALEALRTLGRHHSPIADVAPAGVGFCFGGGNVLDLCRAGVELTAAVSIHGELVARDPVHASGISAPLLVLHGAADPVSPDTQRIAFEAEMNAAGAHWSMMIFGGAVHSFTDPKADVAGIAKYEPNAARWAFRLTDQFLEEAFSGG